MSHSNLRPFIVKVSVLSVHFPLQIIGCYITYQWKTGTYIYIYIYIYIFEDYYLLVNNVLSTLFLFYLIKSFLKCAYFDTRCMRADDIRYSAPVSTVFSYNILNIIYSDFMTIL